MLALNILWFQALRVFCTTNSPSDRLQWITNVFDLFASNFFLIEYSLQLIVIQGSISFYPFSFKCMLFIWVAGLKELHSLLFTAFDLLKSWRSRWIVISAPASYPSFRYIQRVLWVLLTRYDQCHFIPHNVHPSHQHDNSVTFSSNQCWQPSNTKTDEFKLHNISLPYFLPSLCNLSLYIYSYSFGCFFAVD